MQIPDPRRSREAIEFARSSLARLEPIDGARYASDYGYRIKIDGLLGFISHCDY